MRKIILIIFSFCLIHSSQSLAKIGDVYYCTTSNNVTVTAKKVHRHREERFTFKRTGKKLIFGKGKSSFANYTMYMDYEVGTERFKYKRSNSSFAHQRSGKFLYKFHAIEGKTHYVNVVFGSCSVF